MRRSCHIWRKWPILKEWLPKQKVISITEMALYDRHTFKTEIKNNILHVHSMKKGPTFWGSNFVDYELLLVMFLLQWMTSWIAFSPRFTARGIKGQGAQVPNRPTQTILTNLSLRVEIPARLGHHLISGKSTKSNHTSIKLAQSMFPNDCDRWPPWYLSFEKRKNQARGWWE